MQPENAPKFDILIDGLMPAVLAAARLELEYFAQGVSVERKSNKTPVTVADREAENILVDALSEIVPDIPIVAEEAFSDGHRPSIGRYFFLVDALDGTHMFVRQKPEFSINVGLIENGAPVFGLIYGPHQGALYATTAPGVSQIINVRAYDDWNGIAQRRGKVLRTRTPQRDQLIALNSRATGNKSADYLDTLGVDDRQPLGSSLKFCRIAAGDADLYARMGDTSEWDTAAGQAILEAAGGSVVQLDGKPLSYGHHERNFRNPHFVAWGREPISSG